MEALAGRLSDNKPLFTSDELAHYATLLKEMYPTVEQPAPTGKPGRPRKPPTAPQADLDYATVHKTRVKGRVTKVERKIVYGDEERIAARLATSPSRTINTSYVERVNGTLRQTDAHLRRKALTFAKAWRWFEAKLALTTFVYDFIRPHGTLSRNPDRTTTPRTPAMKAGLAESPWSWTDLLQRPILCNC
jgi:hypothetical protein